MEKIMDLAGTWRGKAEGINDFYVILPGTLDTNGIGKADEDKLETRLTRVHKYEGKVRYFRNIKIPDLKDGRLFLKVERTRELELEIDGCIQTAYEEGTLSTPWLYEITEYAGRNVQLVLSVDNRYTIWPRDSIIGASAATDETQTNWNGILGDFAIYKENDCFFKDLRVYPVHKEKKIQTENTNEEVYNAIEIYGELDGVHCDDPAKGNLYAYLESDALKGKKVCIPQKEWLKEGYKIAIKNIPLSLDCRLWDEEEGNLYKLKVKLQRLFCLEGNDETDEILAEKTVTFGVRFFSMDDRLRLTLNGRRFFLRGEANCCVFPEEGHPPVTEEEWEKLLAIYASYGVNCMRFHSWCPPEAAFCAADKAGMMMQPELSQWNFKDAFGDERARKYYRTELHMILKHLANHPSFVMLTFGNELQYTEEGDVYAENLLAQAKAYDSTRLYANSSNYHYGEEGTDPGSDFYTAMAYYNDMLRATSSPMIGHLNHEYPSTKHNYKEAVENVLKNGKPVFGFEVGQYEVLPEFSEIADFHGVTRAVNLEIIRDKVKNKGIFQEWERYVEATGELANLCYREEVEAVLRTEGMSGLSLLGLQDFPGQGTALVGMLNSHLHPKPYAFAQPQRFRTFFSAVLPLLYLGKYTYISGEVLKAHLKLANYGKKKILGVGGWQLLENGTILDSAEFPQSIYEPGSLLDVGELCLQLPETITARRLEICIYVGEYRNSYPIWIYSGKQPKCPDGVLIADKLTNSLLNKIEAGEIVYLEPEPKQEFFPCSIGGQFTTDFWSVGTFPEQEGAMGMVIDDSHPALSEFPSEFYCNYQWWPMSGGRPMILPGHIRPIVTVPDSYSRLKHMGLLFEASFGKGRVMVSSMGLLGKQNYPECRGLLSSLLNYLGKQKTEASPRINEQFITREEMQKIITVSPENGEKV